MGSALFPRTMPRKQNSEFLSASVVSAMRTNSGLTFVARSEIGLDLLRPAFAFKSEFLFLMNDTWEFSVFEYRARRLPLPKSLNRITSRTSRG